MPTPARPTEGRPAVQPVAVSGSWLLYLLALIVCGPPVTGWAQVAGEDVLPPLPPLEPTKEPPTTWAAWQSVQRMLGYSQADVVSTYSFSSDTSRRKESLQDHATVFMELERQDAFEVGSSRSIGWRVTEALAQGGTHSTYSNYGLGAGQWLGGEGVEQGTYTGPLSLRVEPRLFFSLETGQGGFGTLGEPPEPWLVESSGTVTELGAQAGTVTVRSFSEIVTRDPGRFPLEHSWINFTAPKAAVPFTGLFHLDQVTREGRGSLRRTATFQFWPEWADVELEVTIEVINEGVSSPKISFGTWRPEGNTADPGQPGPRPLKIIATLRPKEGATPSVPPKPLPEVRRFRFELANTSQEPGVCLNWPSPRGETIPREDPEYDLRFVATVPQAMVVSPRRQKAGVRPLPGENPQLPSGWVFLECFDFGAYADLRVYAELADGREIVGYLETDGKKEYLIRIPERTAGSRIAEHWKETKKVRDDDAADQDDQPTGDGQKGDGFSVYEEYRGFRVNGAHVSTDPAVKNLFVRDANGGPVGAACRLLETNTAEPGREGLSILDGVKEEEWHASRVMNVNRSSKSPGSSEEPQHGLLLRPSPAKGETVVSFTEVTSEPPRPKNVNAIWVHRLDNSVSTIAHEIGHAIGVEHHGDVDYYARWSVAEAADFDGTKRLRFVEQRMTLNSRTGELTPSGGFYPIRILNEGQATEIAPPAATNGITWYRSVFIAQRGGQNSGQQLCLTRYNNASAYVPAGRSYDRILSKRTIVIQLPGADIHTLCRSCQGTGFNPRRYGHAHLGNCLSQICVRDSALLRPAPTGLCPDLPPPPPSPGNP
jgi:hypothetical protein